MTTKYILILSHARSYSSLLSHILGSSPEIRGYRELHQSYTSYSDLQHLQRHAAIDQSRTGHYRYSLDKIVLNKHNVSNTVLLFDCTYKILMIRTPEDAIRSMLAMAPFLSEQFALELYTTRLLWLQTCAQTLRDDPNTLPILGEDLIERTDETLAGITSFLSLTTPLEERYSLFPLTGVLSNGDISKYMMTGTVQKIRDVHPVILSPQTRAIAWSAYDQCLHSMRKLPRFAGAPS